MRLSLAFIVVALVTNLSFANSGFRDREGILLVPHVDLDIGAFSNTNADSRVTFSGGLMAQYLWTLPGVYLGLQYHDRGVKFLSATSNAGFIDIDGGFMLVGRRGDIFTENAMHQLRLGFFYALPMADYKGDLLGTFPSKSFFGIGIEATTFYPINENFALGLNVYTKIGLSSGFNTTDNKAVNFGFGLAAAF